MAGTRVWLGWRPAEVANHVLDIWLLSEFCRRLMTAMLRSSNGWSMILTLKAVQNDDRHRGFARLSPRHFIAREIGGSVESAVPDRLRGGYLQPSPASFGNSGPRDAIWWFSRPGGSPGLLCPTCRRCVAASLAACPSSGRVAMVLPCVLPTLLVGRLALCRNLC